MYEGYAVLQSLMNFTTKMYRTRHTANAVLEVECNTSITQVLIRTLDMFQGRRGGEGDTSAGDDVHHGATAMGTHSLLGNHLRRHPHHRICRCRCCLQGVVPATN